MTVYLRDTERKIKDRKKKKPGISGDATTSLLYVLIFAAFFRELLVFLGMTAFSTVFYYGMIVVLACICGLTLVRMFNENFSVKEIFEFIAGIVLSVLILSLNIFNSSFTYSSNGKSMIGLLMITVFLCCESSIKVTPKVLDCYLFFNLLQSFYLAVGMLIPSNYFQSDLIYKYASTNHAGIMTMLTAIWLFIMLAINLKRKKRFLCFLSAVMLVLMIAACYLTRSRASFLSIALFLAVSFVMSVNKKVIVPLTVVIMIAVLIFPLLWVAFYEAMGGSSDATVFGKTIFSGREIIWISIIESVLSQPFAVHISEEVLTSIGTNHSAHNALWELMWNYTVWFMVAYFAFLISKVTDAYRDIKGKISLLFYVGIVVVFFHMCFETTFISGAVNFVIKAFLMIPMMRGVTDDVPFKDNGGGAGLQRSAYLK